MGLQLGNIFPDFTDPGSSKSSFYQWIRNSWFMLILNLDVDTNPTLFELLSDELKERDLKSLILTKSKEEDRFYFYDRYSYALSPSILQKMWVSISGITGSERSSSTKIFIVDPNKNIRSILTYSPFSIRNLDETFNILDTIRLCESQYPGKMEEQLIAPEERVLKSRRFSIDSLLLPLN
jgi:hypothetical protein